MAINGVLWLDDYGAKHDGSDDASFFAAVTAALNAAGGGEIWLTPGATYTVFTSGQPTQSVLMPLANARGTKIRFNGATILVGRTWGVGDILYVFEWINCPGVIIEDMRVAQTNPVVPPIVGSFYGTHCFTSSGGSENIVLVNPVCDGCLSLAAIQSHGVKVINGKATNSEYGIILNDGDLVSKFANNVEIGLETSNVARSLFLLGAKNVKATVTSQDAKANDILISSNLVGAVTENIKITYRAPKRTDGQQGQSIYIGSPIQAVYRNIEITLDIDKDADVLSSPAVIIGKGTTAAVGNVYDNITMRGNVRNVAALAGPVIDICAAADAPWTGEVVRGVHLENLGIAADGPGPTLHIDLGGVQVDDPVTLHKVSAPLVALSLLNGSLVGKVSRRDSSFYQKVFPLEAYSGPPTWTGSVTNPAIGNGAAGSSWWRDGGAAIFNVSVVIGSTTTFGTGDWRFAPSAVAALPISPGQNCVGVARAQQGATVKMGIVFWRASTGFLRITDPTTGAPYSATVPFTWGSGDTLDLNVPLILN